MKTRIRIIWLIIFGALLGVVYIKGSAVTQLYRKVSVEAGKAAEVAYQAKVSTDSAADELLKTAPTEIGQKYTTALESRTDADGELARLQGVRDRTAGRAAIYMLAGTLLLLTILRLLLK